MYQQKADEFYLQQDMQVTESNPLEKLEAALSDTTDPGALMSWLSLPSNWMDISCSVIVWICRYANAALKTCTVCGIVSYETSAVSGNQR